MSFKLKTLLLLLFISLVPYIVTMLIVGSSYKKEKSEQIVQNLNNDIDARVEFLSDNLSHIKKDILFISRADVMNDIYSNDIDRRISHLLQMKKADLKLIEDLYVADTKETIIASSNFNEIGTSVKNHHPFYSIPIYSSFNAKQTGTLYLDYSYKNLLPLLKSTPHRQFFIQGHEDLKQATYEAVIQVNRYLKDYDLTLILEEDKAFAFQLLHKYTVWFIIALIVGFILISMIALYFAQSLTTPIVKLSHTAETITQTQDYTKRVPYQSEDEIGQLAEAFNQMVEGMFQALQENRELNAEIEDTQKEVVFTMGAIGESRSKETGNHVKRVAEYSKLLATLYGLDENEAEMLKQASPMHDIGKIAIPDAILNKPGRFTEAEFVHMQKHAQLGYDMLKHSDRPLLKTAAIVAYEHHEKYNGSGYPRGVKGEEIHIYGRITALADVFDALGSDRVYKQAWDDEKIFALFKEERGEHFDPKLIDLFFEHLDQFLKIREAFKE